MTDLNDADIVEGEQEVSLGRGVGRSLGHDGVGRKGMGGLERWWPMVAACRLVMMIYTYRASR